MALPPTAKTFAQALDPSDTLDFYVYVSQGDADASPAPILLTGEGIASYALALTSEAVAAGLQILTAPYANSIDGNEITIWLGVDAADRGAPIFDGAGVTVGIELTVVTTAVPARRKQRTFLVRIAHQ